LIHFGLLGPVVSRRGGVLVPVRPPKVRTLLAALLLKPNQAVSVDYLINVIWGSDPPVTAIPSLQNHVARLRAHLAADGTGNIKTVTSGYLLEVPFEYIDTEVFSRLSKLGTDAKAAGNWEDAVTSLTAALDLWRGNPLTDVSSPVLHATEVPRLSQMHLNILEARVDARLQLGHYQDVIAELIGLTSLEPLREQFHGQLMLAYDRAGRRAEALATYRRARNILVEELGIEPSAALQELHSQILSGEGTAGTAEPVVRLRESTGITVPATKQLPPDTTDFTGRDEQIEMLSQVAGREPKETRPGALAVAVITGMAGVGKTALAVHVAHRLRDRFPDGQLFAHLQGASRPLQPVEVLTRFLLDLGVPDAAIPTGEADLVARYRTAMASRRILIVLDDARDAAQVRPLLPGTANCAVIVTSRNVLADLTGAQLTVLGVLDGDDSRALFTAIVGEQRAAAEPAAAAEVLELCGGLPLAIRLAGSRLSSRPSWSVRQLAAKLADKGSRLAELATGDVAVRASFGVSYAALPTAMANPANVFRLLGLPDAESLSLSATIALTGQPDHAVVAALDVLADSHMLSCPAPDRIQLHDLLRSYAAELAGECNSQEEKRAALARMFRWYRDQAMTAARTLAPGRRLPIAAVTESTTLTLSDPGQALDWFGTERASLTAATKQAAELGMHDLAAQIAAAMWGFFQRTPHTEDWLRTSEIGVDSARHLGDGHLLSWLLNSLGQVHGLLGHFSASGGCLTEALAIRRRLGDRSGEATVLNSLALDLYYQERFEDALDYLWPALAIHEALGEGPYAAIVLNNIGEFLLRLKRHDEALAHLRKALAIRHEARDGYGEAVTEGALGDTYLDLGDFTEAINHYQRALVRYRKATREHSDEANILMNLGHAFDSLGQDMGARQAWQAALPILAKNNDPRAAQLRARLANPKGT
jgi:DNA-binding SARP family transcriptional activator